ncbi:ureidoglycolate dehydrogenase [Desulfosediminicola sp.]|uniref:ureidoglycolate dehydrogenase n=1 Tax=Desulfosediminicola sp. TaxID=2886825 RepID=UPI003AF28801
MADVRVDYLELLSLVVERLRSAGLKKDHAERVADVLVHADLRGVRSHGVMRTEHYVKRIGAGSLNCDPSFTLRELRSGAAVLNADAGMGHVACYEAMDKAIDMASESGIAMVGVENGSHCGALSYFTMQAVEKGMIGMAVTHTDKCVAPYGGGRAFFGTNPIAFAFPTHKHPPVVLDMATSNTAFGKVLHAKETGTEIPADWGIDGNGAPTTDPNAVEALIPFGGHKGFGLALVIDVLTGVLMGAKYGPHINAMYGDYDKPRELASLMIAIDPGTFTSAERFRAQMDAMVDDLHAEPAAPGCEQVYVPGELEVIRERENKEHGVPVVDSIYEWLQKGA